MESFGDGATIQQLRMNVQARRDTRDAQHWRVGAYIAILLLAAVLRFYRLDAQSFWNDEGNTARLVERPLALILEGAAGDIHPPGYYLLLNAWRAVAGESEFALRSYSALCGILTVAFTAEVGRRAGGWRTAFGAALFAAVHPLSVYYSQEARMYAQLGLASALTVWVAMRLVVSPKSQVQSRRAFMTGRVLAFAGAIALGLYTQYAYVFVLVGLNAGFVVLWLEQRPWNWRILRVWVVAHLLAGTAFLPWAPIALRAGDWRPPDLGADALGALVRALTVGITLPADKGAYVTLIAGGLLLFTIITRSRTPFIKWIVLGMALMPPGLILAFGFYRPAYLKFMMSAVAPLGVALALPLSACQTIGYRENKIAARLSRWSATLLFLLLLPNQITALRHLYTDPAYARDDYRSIAAQIAAEGRSGDAILLSAPNQWEVFTYYYRGPLPVYPAPYRPDPAEAKRWIDNITASHTHLYVLFWGDVESDPARMIEPYLAQHAYKAGDTWISSVRLSRYGTAALPNDTAERLNVQVGDVIRLLGYTLPETAVHPGDIIPLTLFWQADEAPTARYKVFIHLINEAGTLVAQTDNEPVGGFVPTTQWQPGERVVDRYGILLPRDIPEGAYTLLVGMYDLAGQRLPITRDGIPQDDALRLIHVNLTLN